MVVGAQFERQYEAYVKDAADSIRKKLDIGDQEAHDQAAPIFGITLGSGLGDLASEITNAKEVPYERIWNFPRTTVEGHEGKLIYGELEGVRVLALKGRKHFYEVAHEPGNRGILQAVFAVHTLAELGVKNYFATNATGGLNTTYKTGNVMIIRSHINLLPNPLAGRHHKFTRVDNGERVERFQPMNGAYDSQLRKLLHKAGAEFSEHVHEGVYLAVTGPTYETEAESVAFRDALRADNVGMSVAPEVIVARNRGMKAVGLSCITNCITQDGTNATNHEEVAAVLESSQVRERLSTIVKNFFALYKKEFV